MTDRRPIRGPRGARWLAALATAAMIWGVSAQEVAPADPPAEKEAPLALDAARFTLRNGLRVVVVEQPGVTSFTATFLHQAGVAREWQGLRGAAHLVGASLDAGTTRVGTKGWRQEQRILGELDRIDRELAKAVDDGRKATDPAQRAALSGRVDQLRAELAAAMERHRAATVPGAWAAALAEAGADGPHIAVGHDAVSYSVTAPAGALGRVLALEGQRLGDVVPRSFYEDRQALASEWSQAWRAGGAAPLLEAMSRAAFLTHPYGRYQGNADQLMGIDRGELTYYLRTFTAPSRTVLAVVGGVSAAEVRRQAERSLARVSGGAPAAELEGVEEAQRGERRVTVIRPGPAEILAAYHAPRAQDPGDSATLAVLAELLGHPTEGMLSQVLALSGQTGAVSAGIYPRGGPLGPRDPALMVLGLRLDDPLQTCAVEAELSWALAVLATDGPPSTALVAARARARARITGLWADNELMAPAVAWTALTRDDPGALVAHLQALDEVGAPQVQALAARLFNPAGRTIAVGWPAEAAAPGGCAPDGAAMAR